MMCMCVTSYQDQTWVPGLQMMIGGGGFLFFCMHFHSVRGRSAMAEVYPCTLYRFIIRGAFDEGKIVIFPITN